MQKTLINYKNYKLLFDSYYATGGYEDNSYLIKHKRETQQKYKNRQELAYFLNYTKPIVDAHINPIFANATERETNNKLFEDFLNNVDFRGTKIDDFIKTASLESQLFGVTYIIMDNVNYHAQNMQEVMEKRLFPYIYTVTPDKIEDIQLDEFSNILSFSFKENVDNDDPTKGYNIRTFDKNGWKVQFYSINPQYTNVISEGTYDLGKPPVIAFKSHESKQIIPTSEYLSVAKTNNNVYQLCSWVTEIQENITFPILTYPKNIADNSTTLSIGTSNALAFSEEATHTPNFIAPPSEPLQALTEQIDRLIQEMYRMGGLSFSTGVQKQESGIAKAYDFATLNHSLEYFATQIEKAEEDIAKLFSAWIKQDVRYNVTYVKNYNISDIDEVVNNTETLLNMPINSVTFRKEVISKFVTSYFDNLKDDIKEKIMQEIEEDEKIKQENLFYNQNAGVNNNDADEENEDIA